MNISTKTPSPLQKTIQKDICYINNNKKIILYFSGKLILVNKKIIFLPFLFSFCLLLKAQQPLDLLNKWGEQSPIQKIYLQLDRDNYMAGQTAQFKAYLSADFLPDTSNSSVYVALYDGTKLINKSVFPVLFSSSLGSIDFPDSLATGYYTIRSFSKGMLSQKEDYFFQRKIFINGIEKKQISTAKNDTLRVEFFPEGGNLVNDLTSTVAFKITDKNGLPVDDIVGKLYNSKNEELVYFSCLHDGMGLFDFKPLAGEKYYVKLKTNLPDKKYFLPEIQPKGIVLSIIHESNTSLFEIKQKMSDTAFVAAYMIGQMQHHVIFKKEFSKKEDFVTGSINTKNLPSGIMQITVFNKDDIPLSERLIFVNNNEYWLAADVKIDSLDFSEGGRNKFFITLKDTVQGQISVSITDPTFDVTNKRENNIISGLLLSSDINGYISNPAWYLSSNEDSVKNALDLLMMVNGWRRFKWTEIANQKKIAKSSNAFISLKGRATIEGYKKPFANKQMMLMVNSLTAKNKRSNHILETDKDGTFKIDSLILFGKNKLFFTDIIGKKSSSIDVSIDVSIDTDTLFAGIPLLVKNGLSFKDEKGNYLPILKLEYDKLQKSNVLLLNEVIVNTKKKTPLEIIETKYATGVFGGFANKSIDLVNSDEAHKYMNIFDYLQTNVNGVRVVNDGPDYKLYYRQPSSSETANMTLYLDEIETDAAIIANFPPSQIGFIKVYSTFLGGTGNSQGGAISIYSKKGEDFTTLNQASNIKIYNGYTVMKEFYAPNYKLNKTGLNNDNRITIDWRPQIFINNINPKIPISFYNNNRTKKFKVVVEGMTNSGKLIWLEKMIEK
jgi:hypothetical protein